MARFSVGLVSLPLLFLAASSCNSGSLTIDTQPADQTVALGATATFSVVASGTAPLTYQWQRNDSPITGATLASFTTAPTVALDSGTKFRAVVTDSSGSVTSGEAKLTVTGGNTGPQTLTVHTTDLTGSGDPPFIAFQDGDGAWQSVTHNASGDYSFTVTSDRYGVAVADPTSAPLAQIGYIVQATVSEQPMLQLPMGFPPDNLYQADAQVYNLPDGGTSANLLNCGQSDSSGHVSCLHVPEGLFDAVGVAENLYIVKAGTYVFASAGITDLGGFDFLRSFQVQSYMLTLHGLPPKQPLRGLGGFRQRFGRGGEDLVFGNPAGNPVYTADANGDVTFPIKLFPGSAISSDFLQMVSLSTMRPTAGSDPNSDIVVVEYFSGSGDQTFTFPALFSVTGTSLAATTPYARAQASWNAVSNLGIYAFTQAGTSLKWTAYVTNGWLGNASSAHYVFPDLSTTTGWSSALEYPSGTAIVADLSGYSYSGLNAAISSIHQPPRFYPKVGDHVVQILKAPTVLTVP